MIPALIAIGLYGAWLAFNMLKGEKPPDFNETEQRIFDQTQEVVSLHSSMGFTRPGDWLKSHPERGQTFDRYRKIPHITFTEQRNILYVLPLGEFDPLQKRIVDLSAEFLGLYFACDVKVMDPIGLDAIPQKARRVHKEWGVRQIHTEYVLDELLIPRVSEDAFAVIAFTTSDLYPEDSWNFVYGQASLSERVGVWSLFRNGDPRTEFDTVLTRTLKTATHETGHMFSIEHCIAYNCNMCGRNNMGETDRRPLYMCPECLPKILLATDCDLVERMKQLYTFCEKYRIDEPAKYYKNCLDILD